MKLEHGWHAWSVQVDVANDQIHERSAGKMKLYGRMHEDTVVLIEEDPEALYDFPQAKVIALERVRQEYAQALSVSLEQVIVNLRQPVASPCKLPPPMRLRSGRPIFWHNGTLCIAARRRGSKRGRRGEGVLD